MSSSNTTSTSFRILIFLCTIWLIKANTIYRPCPELSPLLKFPCKCSLETLASDPEHLEVSIDCNGVVFNEDGPQLPYGAPIVSYLQRNSGQQKLSLQVNRKFKSLENIY